MTAPAARAEPAGQPSETAARREALLDAALELFAERGYRGTSVAAVAAAIGITDAGVLYHFGTKERLLVAALAHYDQKYEQRWRSGAVTGRRFLEAVGEWGVGMEADPAVSSLLVMLSAEHLVSDTDANAYFRRRYLNLLHRCRDAFAEAAATGELRADLDADAEASALLAHIDGIRFQWFFTDGEVSMATSIRRYVASTLERLALS